MSASLFRPATGNVWLFAALAPVLAQPGAALECWHPVNTQPWPLVQISRPVTLSFCLRVQSLLLTLRWCLIETLFKKSSNSTICSDTKFPWMIRNRPHPASHSIWWICLSLPCSSLLLDFICEASCHRNMTLLCQPLLLSMKSPGYSYSWCIFLDTKMFNFKQTLNPTDFNFI